MTEDDRMDIALRVLFETFGHTPTPAQVQGYRIGLEGIPADAIGSAVRLALRESEKMPTPARLRALVRAQAVQPLCPALPAVEAERERVRDSWRGKTDEVKAMVAELPKGPVRAMAEKLAKAAGGGQ